MLSGLSVVLIFILVTRNRIPDAEYESWNTQPIVAGSDSECDSDGDSLEAEPLSEADSTGNDADHNPNLASSLMELELSDSEQPWNARDRKGKGRLMTVETPNNVNQNCEPCIPFKLTRTELTVVSSQTDSYGALPR